MKWLPIETIPTEQIVLVLSKKDEKTKIMALKMNSWMSEDKTSFIASEASFTSDNDDMFLAYSPIKDLVLVRWATHWAPIPNLPVDDE